ncbi:hypothetical protein D3C81_1649610 [compost metagenome]
MHLTSQRRSIEYQHMVATRCPRARHALWSGYHANHRCAQVPRPRYHQLAERAGGAIKQYLGAGPDRVSRLEQVLCSDPLEQDGSGSFIAYLLRQMHQTLGRIQPAARIAAHRACGITDTVADLNIVYTLTHRDDAPRTFQA